MLITIEGLMLACNCGSAALIESTVVMMFAPGCRKMMSKAARLPFAKPMDLIVCTESWTLATLDRYTGWPLL
jgi:hypothetical protein